MTSQSIAPGSRSWGSAAWDAPVSSDQCDGAEHRQQASDVPRGLLQDQKNQYLSLQVWTWEYIEGL